VGRRGEIAEDTRERALGGGLDLCFDKDVMETRDDI